MLADGLASPSVFALLDYKTRRTAATSIKQVFHEPCSIDAWNQLYLGRRVRVVVSLSSCVAVYGMPVLVADC